MGLGCLQIAKFDAPDSGASGSRLQTLFPDSFSDRFQAAEWPFQISPKWAADYLWDAFGTGARSFRERRGSFRAGKARVADRLNGGLQEKMRPTVPPPTCVRPGAGGRGGAGEGGHSRQRTGLWAASQPHPGPRAPPPARGGPPATLQSAETAEPRAENCEGGWEGPDESGRRPIPIEAASKAVPQPQSPPRLEPMAKLER